MGYYVVFQSKTMVGARAHFPLLSEREMSMDFAMICPVRALVDMSQRGLIKKGSLKRLNQGQRLTKYLHASQD